jgi:hypothetical protein
LGGGHPFHDQHDAGAGGAAQLNVSGRPIRAGRCAERFAAARKCGFPPAGQNVKKESAQKLIC